MANLLSYSMKKLKFCVLQELKVCMFLWKTSIYGLPDTLDIIIYGTYRTLETIAFFTDLLSRSTLLSRIKVCSYKN